MIISNWDNQSGFFSMFFFFVNQYIYAQKNNINLKINSEKWLFKSEKGWEDYFINIDINNNKDIGNTIECEWKQILQDFPLFEYKNILDKIWIYNQKTKDLIENKKKELNLENENYASIFIRRGDKLVAEANIINSHIYLDFLLELNPNYKIIYLQTDDYNCYLDLINYVNFKNLDIKILSTCKKEYEGGMVIFDFHKNNILNKKILKKNNSYIENNIKSFQNTKPINLMKGNEMYNHIIEMIIGIDIVLNSKLVVADFSSGVANFIKLKHKTPENVWAIQNKSNYINYNNIICPSYKILPLQLFY
jgi:hypothetical protein